jgi:hypothetical protein
MILAASSSDRAPQAWPPTGIKAPVCLKGCAVDSPIR